MHKLIAVFAFFCLPLNAHTPNWSFDESSQGWNNKSLAKLYFHNSEPQRQWAWGLLGKYRFKGDEKILDFGCGDGKITAEISRLVSNGCVLGIDISPEMVHLAHIKFPVDCYSNLEFKQSHSLTFEDFSADKHFDLICSFAVFHLIANPLETLKNLKTHLEPSGKLLLVIPSNTSPVVYPAANEMFAKYGLQAPWKNTQSVSLTMRSLDGCAYFLKEAGYNILSLELIETEDAFYDLSELVMWMMASGSGNWNIPYPSSQAFFTDMVHRMVELDPTLIDQEGRVRLKAPKIHVIAENP